ncbi:MAG: transposase [Eubacteriaceae bacterium]|nr:transposase [Eubacteriaceae bacterium]
MSPRPERLESSLNAYHILIIGNNNESVFKDEEDKQTFWNLLAEKNNRGDCALYAYCILYNKANLLISPTLASLSDIMKQVNVSYAVYYNKKYSRCGHVFRDRFRSVAINSKEQFETVKEYIGLLPFIEGVIAPSQSYPFVYPVNPHGHDLDKIIGYYDKCFSNLHQIALAIVERYLFANGISFDMLKHDSHYERRDELVILIRDSTGYSIRKISDLLDINRGEVYKIIQLQKNKEGS